MVLGMTKEMLDVLRDEIRRLRDEVVELKGRLAAQEMDHEEELSPLLVEKFYLLEIAEQARRYHVDCGHDEEGSVSQCDGICEAWKNWKKLCTASVTLPKDGQ